jgi:ABC-2 type transport system ATP-binding protein
MNTPIIETKGLSRRFGKTDAVNGLSLSVPPGRCYGFFGRNGAGKTTTIKCLLNLLRPTAGTVRVFGLDPRQDEVSVKSRLCYVPDAVAFYPWMTVRDTLNYLASFRPKWNGEGEENRGPLQRAEDATGAHQRHRAGTGIAGAGRADVGAGSHRPPRIH